AAGPGRRYLVGAWLAAGVHHDLDSVALHQGLPSHARARGTTGQAGKLVRLVYAAPTTETRSVIAGPRIGRSRRPAWPARTRTAGRRRPRSARRRGWSGAGSGPAAGS